MNTNEKLNWANFIAVIHFLISFYTDHFFFEPISKLNFGYWLFAKIIYFFFLQLGWMFIYRVMKRPKWRRILINSIPEYEKGVFRIIAKNPDIYLKSRLKAFQHICSNSFGVSGYYVDKNGNVSKARIIWLELFGGQVIPIEEGDTNGVLLVKQICNLIKKAMYNYWWIWTVFAVALICAIKRKTFFYLPVCLRCLHTL